MEPGKGQHVNVHQKKHREVISCSALTAEDFSHDMFYGDIRESVDSSLDQSTRNLARTVFRLSVYTLGLSLHIPAGMNLDPVIIEYGQHSLNKCGMTLKSQCIREKMRELGRLLDDARKQPPLKKTEDFINPANYLEMVKAVKSTCSYNTV